MKEKYPEFVQQLEDHGLIYIRRLADQDDLSSVLGRGWKSTFLTDDKTTAEKRSVGLCMISLPVLSLITHQYI